MEGHAQDRPLLLLPDHLGMWTEQPGSAGVEGLALTNARLVVCLIYLSLHGRFSV